MGQESQTGAWGTLSSLKDEPGQQASTLPSFRVGQVLSDTFKTFFGNFFRFWAVSLLVIIPTIVGFWAMGSFMVPDPDAPVPTATTGFFISFFGTMAWAFVSIAAMMAAVTYGAIEHQAGRKAPLLDMLKVAAKSLFPVVVAMVLSGILYMIGWLLFVVPGIIVGLMLCVTIPSIVAEGLGPLKGMHRSRELTTGFKWPILGCLLVMIVLAQLVNFAVMIPMMFAGTTAFDPSLIGWVSTAVTFILMGSLYAFMGSGVAAIYTNLRAAKEGVPTEEIAKVFA